MSKYSLSALVAAGLLAGGMSVSSASAADLGGNCCADLEERIAELEATTARKGNRKVSLTVSGWVGQQVTWWDDGSDSNVYVTDLGSTLASHVKFTGQAQILPGWTAGYVLHLEAIGSDSLTTSQDVADGPNAVLLSGSTATNGVSTLQSFWFIKSDQLGKVSVGKQSQASDNTAILVDGSGSLVPANWVPFDFFSFFVRRDNGALTNLAWAGAGTWGDVNGLPTNSVRYDSPTFGGFSVSASWGEDDFWDVAARYAGEWHDFKVAVAAAYSQTSDNHNTNAFFPAGNTLQPIDTGYFQIGAYAEHVPTGLFAYGAYGHLNYGGDHWGDARSNDTWYGKAGIRQRWNPLGHTVLYGEYEHIENRNGTAFTGPVTDTGGGVTFYDSSSARLWGVGAVQEIDAAAMSLWLKYRNIDASFSGVETNSETGFGTDNFQEVTFGALINF
ncbi:porin [Hyphomicrobium denitrificans]|uniref:porin n=1 Tax=Hyphomicrobium denitrificans TaxID=53399 RepID=UPI00022E3F0F|nr:porin [Hyphomicrobium denitrificans]